MVVRDVRDGASVGQMPRGGPINAVSYSADGKHILAAGDDRTARIFSSRGHPEHVLSGHTDAVNAAVYSPNGRDVLTGSADGSARIWSARQGETALPGTVAQASFAFSPDGRRLLAVGSKGRAVIWDTRHPGAPVVLDDGMPNPLGYVPPCGRATGCAAWSPDSRTMYFSDSHAGSVWAWDFDPATAEIVATIPSGGSPIDLASGFGSVWAANLDDATAVRVDPATNEVTATIDVGAAPDGITVGAGSRFSASDIRSD